MQMTWLAVVSSIKQSGGTSDNQTHSIFEYLNNKVGFHAYWTEW